MTQEEKAKAYDEALERAAIAYKDEDRHLRASLERIFPELKEESEDERIRKELFVFIRKNADRGDEIEKSKRWIAWLEKQGEQKPADKVEPKFKVGDIITNGKIIGKVDENENNKYHGWFGYNKDLSVHYADIPDVENWHLWTIQDAKDGDVLVSDYEGGVCITILKSVVSSNEIEMYCHSVNSELFIAQSGFSNATWHPATKEQRDTLMKAIADAGYTFDFDKKELKKIEQKSAWSEDDKAILLGVKHVIDCVWHKDTEIYYNSEELEEMWQWLDTIWQRVEYPQANQEWSEEDEKMHQFSIRAASLCRQLAINHQVAGLGYNGTVEEYEKLGDWLKSLRPQNRWKPTEYELEVLKLAAEKDGGSCLMGLYRQLKKLTE